MIPWSSVHRALALGLVGAVAAATVLVGPSDPSDPSDTTPVSAEGEDSTLQEQAVPLVDDPEAEQAPPETLQEDPQEDLQEPQDDAGGTGQGGGDPEAPVAELERTTTDPFNMVGVTWEGGVDLRVEVSYRTAGQWSAFEDLEVEPVDPNEGGRAGTEPLWINDGADGVSVKITSASGELPRDVKVATIDPGEDGLIAPTSGAAGQPPIIMRSSWGAKSASCSTGRPATRGATIHHTAGNNTYSQAQVAGILRSYQDYHRSRGWCDIGYNFLVDRFGRIYEGRIGGITNMVRGAHAGTNGANTYTVGIAMMGTFTNVQPVLATRAAVADLVAWRFRLAGLPARGTHTLDGKSVQRIIGHRDVKATECPGRLGYAWVTSGLRSSVDQRLSAAPPAANPAPTPTYRWPAPSNLRVTGSDASSLSLAWNQVETAKEYVVQVSTNASMSGATSRAFSTTSGRITGLKASTTYYARVMVRHSKDGSALSPWTAPLSRQTAAPAPTYRWPAPANFRVTDRQATSLALAWNQVSTAKKYVVQVSTSASMARPKHFAFTSTSGRVTGLKPSTTYYVRVIVRHSKTNEALSPWTSVVSGQTTTAPASSVNERVIGSATAVAFKGRGFGHGIGMSQYGAYGGAQSGASAAQILARYYPGTAIGTSSRYIRVLVTADNDGSLAVLAASNLRFLQGSRSINLPTSVNGAAVSHWRIEPLASDRRQSTLRYKSGSTWRTYQNMTWSGAADFAAPTMRLAMPGGGTVTYRYKLRAAQPSSGSTSRQTVNVVHLNDYTRGVIPREVPSSWPEQTLRAQAIAARTYGTRSISSGGWYDICDTTACQVYGGVSAETARTDAAVAATANQVLTYQGSPAFTQFSSSSGGFTNQGSQPYLRPVNDPWDATTANPNRSWTQNVPVSTIRARYPSIGTPQRLRVTKRNGHGADGGRVTSLQIVGSSGSVTVTGPAARAAFGLKSDWFGF